MKNFQALRALSITMTCLLLVVVGVFAQIAADWNMSAGDMKIVGSALGKGTVNPEKGDTVKIYFIGGGKGKYVLSIYTLVGEVIHKDSMNGVVEGMFEWSPGKIASGAYVAQIKGPGIDKKQKLVVMR